MSRFIEDEIRKPSPGRKVARWVLAVLIVLCIVQILAGFYMMKNQNQLSGIRTVIGGSFFLLIFYATHWLLRD